MKTEKFCPQCKEIKPIDVFHKNKARHDGVANYCKPCKNTEKKQYKLRHKERIFLQRREYEERPGVQKARYRRIKVRYELDPCFKLGALLRGRLNKALRGNQKAGSAIKDLGCSIQHLKLHLELFWDQGMTWDNYGFGKGKWTIDHIKPLASFDLTDRSQFLEANYYLNLQPMWYLDNISKSNGRLK